MITTTLNRIREHSLHHESWKKLLDGLGKTAGDDEPLPFAKIFEIIGLQGALWCCRAEPQYDKEWRLLTVKYARRVEHLSTDPAVKNANDVAERHANGKATDEELSATLDATWEAAWVAWEAAEAAAEAANAAEYTAAKVAAKVAAEAANAAARAAERAANAATWDAAKVSEREYQAQEFLRVVTETEARET